MAEYREIHGAEVDSIAGTSGTIEGEIFYDSSADAFKLVTNSGVVTLDTEAQTIVDSEISKVQTAWDNISNDDPRKTEGNILVQNRPASITLEE